MAASPQDESKADEALTPEARSRRDALRTITYLMLFRVALATALLLSVVLAALANHNTETLLGPFARFAFALLATTYVATLAYALVLKRIRNPLRFAYVQSAVDLTLIALVVHATGGAQSTYTFLFLIDVVAVAMLPKRYGAASVALASVCLLFGVSLAGYFQVIPPVPGQVVMPWDITPEELLFRLAINMASIASVGVLGMSLASQTRKVGERLVREQQTAGDLASLHQNTIRCLPSGLVTVALNGTITSINEAACEILEINQTGALGQPLVRLVPGFQAVFDEVGALGSVRRHETDAVVRGGSMRHLGVSATPLSDYTGKITGRVIHFQDLTELRRMQVAVERSERLATIGRLAAGIAHEIRNPLASISGSIEILKGQPGTGAESAQLIDIAVREVERLDHLIDDLLAYARPRTEERQRLDLGEVVCEIAKAFGYEKRKIEIAVEVNAQPAVMIEGASSQLRQVLWNLIRNAADAMPKGGSIHMLVAREKREAGEQAVLSIRDTGIGIPKEDVDHIFEPFFSRKTGGSGLGLATVARIVEDHKGTVDVQNNQGAGTTFTLRFPLLG